MVNEKVKTARLSVLSNSLLIILKVIVGMISGSVSILSEAIHSAMDLVAAVIAFFAVRISDQPADETHPYGHGKYENVSGVIEAVLIFGAAIWIILEAIHKIRFPGEVESIGLGALVMVISAGVNIIVSRKLYKVAKKTDSVALEADALHLKVDVYTSLGVAFGLIMIWITDIHLLDPIAAILVALLILRESFELLLRAYKPLLDTSFDPSDLNRLERLLQNHHIHYHDLKTRKAGSKRFIDFHLDLPGSLSLHAAHELTDKIEEIIQTEFPGSSIQIHQEPLSDSNGR